jgi:hypothetical protein
MLIKPKPKKFWAVSPVWGKAAGGGGTPFTWNPADAGTGATLANSNRDFTGTTDPGHTTVRTTAGKTSGLWYCEFTIVTTPAAQPNNEIGICNATAPLTGQFLGASAIGAGYYWEFQNSFANTITVANAIPATQNLANGDIIAVAMNLSNGKAWLAQNNTWKTGDPAADTSPWLTFTVGSDTWFFAAVANTTSGTANLRLASTTTFSPPSGFTAINA